MTSLTSRSELIDLLKSILNARNETKWETLESLFQPSMLIDTTSQSRDAFIENLRSASGVSVRLDSCVVDVNAQAVAGRVIKTETLPDGERYECQEIIITWFVDGRLTTLKRLKDVESRSAKQTATPSTLEELKPTSLDLGALYREYIKSINDKTMEANFNKFCQSSVTHNTVDKTIAEYISLISDSQSAIKGLYFDIQDFIIDKEAGRVAARLKFTGLPVKVWAGAEPNGKSVEFHEHVMYWLDEGKIHWVWSVVDLDTYRRQLQ
ncbi:polyketide cyclase [Fusarium subglutinans]|uniref:Polyketide cyclase n=1 Tax=Gibberella subglutinans TaxID=42677 RepID=A0A8H5QFM2_GIBSU|nr:polyketide cyclase [Fusarium subglutinans]KAF5613597.1 polyketide cyclase [Fusarium subglutinans]